MGKHREGRWQYERTSLVGHGFAGYVRQNGHVIAKVLHDYGTQFNGMEIVPERDDANGRLLAAAPSLLNALRIAIADSCGGCGDCVPCKTIRSIEGVECEACGRFVSDLSDACPALSDTRDVYAHVERLSDAQTVRLEQGR